MAAPDGIFFDEKEMMALGLPNGVVQMLRRVFESDAVNLQADIDTNTDNITTLQEDKADKISSPTLDNLVSQDATGNIQDSGVSPSVIEDKANKISLPTAGNLISQDSGGDIQDAGVDINDLVTLDGTGNPEGSITSNNSRFFVDTAASQLYFNQNVGANTGWVAL